MYILTSSKGKGKTSHSISQSKRRSETRVKKKTNHHLSILYWGIAINKVVVSANGEGTQPYMSMNPFSPVPPPLQAGI